MTAVSSQSWADSMMSPYSNNLGNPANLSSPLSPLNPNSPLLHSERPSGASAMPCGGVSADIMRLMWWVGTDLVFQAVSDSNDDMSSFLTGWRYFFVKVASKKRTAVSDKMIVKTINEQQVLWQKFPFSSLEEQFHRCELSDEVNVTIMTYDYHVGRFDSVVGSITIPFSQLFSQLVSGKPVVLDAKPASLKMKIRISADF